MRLETERLVLRPWVEGDAEELFRYAKDPRVGPVAGWPAHEGVEESREIIRTVFAAPETYAIVLKETGLPVGSVGLIDDANSDFANASDEAEVGYWIGVPYWGRGLVPEAVRELQRHAFEDVGLRVLWCVTDVSNVKSQRAMEKCGFTYQRTEYAMPCELMGDVRDTRVSRLTCEEWRAAHDCVFKGKKSTMAGLKINLSRKSRSLADGAS